MQNLCEPSESCCGDVLQLHIQNASQQNMLELEMTDVEHWNTCNPEKRDVGGDSLYNHWKIC